MAAIRVARSSPGVGSSPRSWSFRGSSVARRPDRPDRFHHALLGALRIAGGWPVDLAVRWRSGSAGGVIVTASDRPTSAWLTAALLPAYSVGSWVETPPRPKPSGWTAVGRALFGPEFPHPWAVEQLAPWSDSVVSAFTLLPPGIELHWRLRPLGPSPATTPPASLVEQPPGFRAQPAPSVARRVADAAAERLVAPRWDVRAVLSSPDRSSGEACGRMVAAAARADGGNGLAWRRVGRLLPLGPPPIVLALSEVAALFPSPGLRLPTPSSGLPGTAQAIPIARSSSGRVWGLPVEPHQGRHALFLGETGMGKSTALLQATVRAAELGGVVFFDPVGDTSRRLLDRLPSRAIGRVVWVSPSVSPVGVYALVAAARPEPAGDRALADLVQALRRVRAGRYADSPFWGPRVEEMVHLALR
ncbi:MAG: hypothetical protein L3K05_08520, partial [Thermoplasmata archaeon]|nr:hypothetical protein [Thermoplasmata archaeon]